MRSSPAAFPVEVGESCRIPAKRGETPCASLSRATTTGGCWRPLLRRSTYGRSTTTFDCAFVVEVLSCLASCLSHWQFGQDVLEVRHLRWTRQTVSLADDCNGRPYDARMNARISSHCTRRAGTSRTCSWWNCSQAQPPVSWLSSLVDPFLPPAVPSVPPPGV